MVLRTSWEPGTLWTVNRTSPISWIGIRNLLIISAGNHLILIQIICRIQLCQFPSLLVYPPPDYNLVYPPPDYNLVYPPPDYNLPAYWYTLHQTTISQSTGIPFTRLQYYNHLANWYTLNKTIIWYSLTQTKITQPTGIPSTRL